MENHIKNTWFSTLRVMRLFCTIVREIKRVKSARLISIGVYLRVGGKAFGGVVVEKERGENWSEININLTELTETSLRSSFFYQE